MPVLSRFRITRPDICVLARGKAGMFRPKTLGQPKGLPPGQKTLFHTENSISGLSAGPAHRNQLFQKT